METKSLRVGSGAFQLEAVLTLTEDGLVATVCTAHYSHVGATAQATPRPSSAHPDKRSATTSVLAIAPHKDDKPAQQLAHNLAAALNVPCAVSCGLHINQASSSAIQQLMENVDAIEKDIISFVKQVNKVS